MCHMKLISIILKFVNKHCFDSLLHRTYYEFDSCTCLYFSIYLFLVCYFIRYLDLGFELFFSKKKLLDFRRNHSYEGSGW